MKTAKSPYEIARDRVELLEWRIERAVEELEDRADYCIPRTKAYLRGEWDHERPTEARSEQT